MKTIYKQGVVCGNKQFRYCDVSLDTHKCINCENSFYEDVKEGDHVIGECSSCYKENVEIVVVYKTTSYNEATKSFKGGKVNVVGKCVPCTEVWKVIDQLYDDFRGEGYFGIFDEKTSTYKSFTDDEFVVKKEEGIDKIASLPKDQLKVFLRAIHGAVER